MVAYGSVSTGETPPIPPTLSDIGNENKQLEATPAGKTPARKARRPGRPTRMVETEYLHAVIGRVPLVEWHRIIGKALADAKGGDRHARDWLSKYLLGPERAAVEKQSVTLTAESGPNTFTFTIATGPQAPPAIDITPPPAAPDEEDSNGGD